jgi:hypothetical protein
MKACFIEPSAGGRDHRSLATGTVEAKNNGKSIGFLHFLATERLTGY